MSGGDGLEDYIDSQSPIPILDWDFLDLYWTIWDLGIGLVKMKLWTTYFLFIVKYGCVLLPS